MNLIPRDSCVFTQDPDMELLFEIERFPVFMGCTESDPSTDQFAPMRWWINRNTGSLQLNPLLPLDVLYAAQHNESYGAIWAAHHREFAAFLHEVGPFDRVFEIGGAHGILCKEYADLRSNAHWTILEPNPQLVEGSPAEVIRGFFDDRFRYDKPLDVVVHSHVFEHVYHPAEFMQHLRQFVPVGKLMVFSVPNLLRFLEACFTNCLNFEHTVFLSEEYILWLLSENGFVLRAKRNFGDHSTFYAAEHVGGLPKTPCPDLYERNKRLYTAFVGYHDKLIADLNQKLAGTQKKVFLFGAHIFSQYLIAHGLDVSKVVSILDNGPGKIGKRLFGTAFAVNSPRILAEEANPLVVLKTGFYNQEIKDDILKNINPNVEFVE